MLICYHARMRHLGLDYGTKKVGVALSDEAGTMGFPHEILPNNPELLGTLTALVAEKGVGAIVMGDSIAFDGTENPVAHEARAFAGKLTDATGIAVSWEPETLTSREARRMHEPREKTRKPASKAAIDDSAAALILTSYLSRSQS